MFEWHRRDFKHFDRGHRVDGFSSHIFHAVSATRITITRVNLAFGKWVLFTWLKVNTSAFRSLPKENNVNANANTREIQLLPAALTLHTGMDRIFFVLNFERQI